ncbi:MAG: hypothetical protein LKJ69_07895 [Lactobacillus sp.]|jgi:hypothetical protein|nr:hypothetical protein [Lactobacillus sp.]MCI2033314.1 hypothetical protein [Lactobacillus sp.]
MKLNSFGLALGALLIFRVVLYGLGLGRDGNFLILVIAPLLVFWVTINVIRWLYAKLTLK